MSVVVRVGQRFFRLSKFVPGLISEFVIVEYHSILLDGCWHYASVG